MPVLAGLFLLGGSYLIIEAIATVALFAAVLMVVIGVLVGLMAIGLIGDMVVSCFKNPFGAPLIWLGYYILAGVMVCTPSLIMFFVLGKHTEITTDHVSAGRQAIGFVLGILWLVLVCVAGYLYKFFHEAAYDSGPVGGPPGAVMSVLLMIAMPIGIVFAVHAAIPRPAPPVHHQSAAQVTQGNFNLVARVCQLVFTKHDFREAFGAPAFSADAAGGKTQVDCDFGILHAPTVIGGDSAASLVVTIITGWQADQDFQSGSQLLTLSGPLSHSVPRAVYYQTSDAGGTDDWAVAGYLPQKHAEITATIMNHDGITQGYSLDHLRRVLQIAYTNVAHSNAAAVVAGG